MPPKVIVVMPAYNAAETLEMTYKDIPKDIVSDVLVVDDASRDNTISVARRMGLKVFVHPKNLGYGGNQKTCYREAMKLGAEIVVMVHPDYQYDSRLIPQIIEPVIAGRADLVLGSRLADGSAVSGGMPLYKYASNRFLTFFENIVLRQHLSEFHTGFRAYSRRLLQTIPFENNTDDFVFDTEVIIQTVAFGFSIAEIACPTRYRRDSSSINFRRSVVYGLSTLWCLVKYILFRCGIWRSRQFVRL